MGRRRGHRARRPGGCTLSTPCGTGPVAGPSGAPSSPTPRAWSTVASTGRLSWPSWRLHCRSQAAASPSGSVSTPWGGSQERRCTRSPPGGAGAVGGASSGSSREQWNEWAPRTRASAIEALTASQRRAQSWAWISSGSGCQDTGSPVSSSNRSPDCWATSSPDRYRSASALVRKARLRWRPLTDQRTIHGRLLRSPERFCTL